MSLRCFPLDRLGLGRVRHAVSGDVRSPVRCQQVSPTSLESQGLIGYLFGQGLFRSVGGDQSQGGSHLIDTLFFVLGQIPTVAASVGIDAQGLDATVDGVLLGAYLASSGLECRRVHPDVWASHDLGQTVERVERVRQSQADGLEASGGVMFDVVLGFVEQELIRRTGGRRRRGLRTGRSKLGWALRAGFVRMIAMTRL